MKTIFVLIASITAVAVLVDARIDKNPSVESSSALIDSVARNVSHLVFGEP